MYFNNVSVYLSVLIYSIYVYAKYKTIYIFMSSLQNIQNLDRNILMCVFKIFAHMYLDVFIFISLNKRMSG